MSDDCLFCKIIAGEIPSNKVYSDDRVYAFHDINAAAPVHILIIPKKHLAGVTSAIDNDQALLGTLLLKGNEIASELGLDESGFRYVINSGREGGQTVAHLHLHLLGGCDGVLTFGDNWVVYQTDHEQDARTWNRDELASVWSSGSFELELRVLEEDRRAFSKTSTFKFQLKAPLDRDYYELLRRESLLAR